MSGERRISGDRPAGPAGGSGRWLRTGALLLTIAVSVVLSGLLLGAGWHTIAGNRNAPWIVGRAAGVGSYLLLVGLVGFGLVLSHPWRTRLRRPSTAARLRVHVSLAAFTLAFTALHVVVLATDSYAGVGWRGALLPMGASYRPVPVTLGVIGLYAGLLTGFTAALSGRLVRRIWWPIHKVAAVSLVLVWLHGVLAGSDSVALRALYLGTALAVLVLGVSRYVARTPADRKAELDGPGTQAVEHSRPLWHQRMAVRVDLDEIERRVHR